MTNFNQILFISRPGKADTSHNTETFVNAKICTKTLFDAKMSSYEEAIKYVANQDLSHLDLQCQDYSTFSWFLFVLVLVCAAWLIKNKRRVAS